MTQADTTQTGHGADDWEGALLRRVARHVENLPAPPPEAGDFGWEEGVLEKLRKRLAAD